MIKYLWTAINECRGGLQWMSQLRRATLHCFSRVHWFSRALTVLVDYLMIQGRNQATRDHLHCHCWTWISMRVPRCLGHPLWRLEVIIWAGPLHHHQVHMSAHTTYLHCHLSSLIRKMRKWDHHPLSHQKGTYWIVVKRVSAPCAHPCRRGFIMPRTKQSMTRAVCAKGGQKQWVLAKEVKVVYSLKFPCHSTAMTHVKCPRSLVYLTPVT